MSIEDLEGDLARNITDFATTTFLTANDVQKYLGDTLWPFLQNMVAEVRDQDNCISDLVNEADDVLQPDTAGIFAAVIISSKMMMQELVMRLTKSPKDAELKTKLAQIRPIITKAEETLEEITIFPEEDEEQTDDDGDFDGADAEADTGGEA